MNVDIFTVRDLVPVFHRVLSGGFPVETEIGTSIYDLLHRRLEISKDYLDGAVQTVFLDGRPVDNLKEAVVVDGSVLALSAAMPGLVGATMRRGGRYAAMRQSISYAPKEAAVQRGSGCITLKLFNAVVRDLGPMFLERGVLAKSSDLLRIVGGFQSSLAEKESRVSIDGSPVDWSELAEIMGSRDRVQLRVLTAPPGS